MGTLVTVGAQAPEFQLPDLNGRSYALADLLGRMVVLNFWSAECVWCERVDHELIAFLDVWKAQVKILWIASNVNESPELIERVASERKLPTVLVDAHQQAANLYGAQTTPHFFVVDRRGKLAYQGAWDDITFRRREATKVYIPMVITSLNQNLIPEVTQTQPYGCALVRFPESTS
jgi:peroxiredoxin